MKSTMVFSMIWNIFFPAQLFNIYFLSFKSVHIKLLGFILQFILTHIFCSFLLLPHFIFFFPLITFILNFVFFLATTYFHSHSYYFSPVQPLETNFLVYGNLTFLFLILKYPCSLSTFSNLCLLAVDRVVIVAFYSIISLYLRYFSISNLKFNRSPILIIFCLKF